MSKASRTDHVVEVASAKHGISRVREQSEGTIEEPAQGSGRSSCPQTSHMVVEEAEPFPSPAQIASSRTLAILFYTRAISRDSRSGWEVLSRHSTPVKRALPTRYVAQGRLRPSPPREGHSHPRRRAASSSVALGATGLQLLAYPSLPRFIEIAARTDARNQRAHLIRVGGKQPCDKRYRDIGPGSVRPATLPFGQPGAARRDRSQAGGRRYRA